MAISETILKGVIKKAPVGAFDLDGRSLAVAFKNEFFFALLDFG
jgi:hypothetical protein